MNKEKNQARVGDWCEFRPNCSGKKLPARKTSGRYKTKTSSALRIRGLHFSGERLAGQYTQPYSHKAYRHAEHHVKERQQEVARANAAKCLKLKCGKCCV